MLRSILSDDLPRSRWLALALVAILVGLAVAPFLFPGAKSLNVAAKICVFILLAASFDLLLGYTGIVSFAHTMFFGIGAYGVALSLSALGASFTAIVVGVLGGTAVAAALALAIGLFSLRVKAIFFAMVTLAVASAFAVLVSQLSTITGGEDGLTYRIPRVLTPAYKLLDMRILDVRIDGVTCFERRERTAVNRRQRRLRSYHHCHHRYYHRCHLHGVPGWRGGRPGAAPLRGSRSRAGWRCARQGGRRGGGGRGGGGGGG